MVSTFRGEASLSTKIDSEVAQVCDEISYLQQISGTSYRAMKTVPSSIDENGKSSQKNDAWLNEVKVL